MKNPRLDTHGIGPYILLTAIALLCCSLPASAGQGQVVHLPDARSLIIEQEGKRRTVSLYALRTPDLDEPFGKAAYAFFVAHLKGQRVDIQPVHSPGEGALVFVLGNQESINEKMLLQGWAWIQDAYCENARLCGRLNDIQTQAERLKRGIWKKIPEDTPPWRWLREHGS